MLGAHDRYPYSAITKRPDYSWPGGKRLAVYIAINVELFNFGGGKGSLIAPPGQSDTPSVYSWRDYGNRVGFWRLLETCERLGLPVEGQLNAAAYERCPDIPDALRAGGHEIVAHGITNSDSQGDLNEADEAALIRETTEIIARHEGAPPAGWMSPWLAETGVTLDLLKEAGYRYILDWHHDDQPVWLTTRAGPILAVPYPIELNDNRAIIYHKATAAQFADMVIDNFDEMLEQSAGQPLVFGLSLHTFVIGQPFRLRQLRRALEHIAAQRDGIWLTTPGAICAHIEGLPRGTVPGS